MFVRRARGGDLAGDQALTRRLLARVRDTGEAGLRVWSPPPHVSFGRRDANDDGFDRAREVAAELGYPTTVRDSGGRAVAFTEGTLAVVLATPVDDERGAIGDRYEHGLDALETALSDCGVDADRGEPPNSFCPGSHSLSVDDRKVVGLAQRVRRDVAVLAGLIVVDDEADLGAVLAPLYDALGVKFETDSVGSLAAAGGVAEPSHVADAVVAAIRAGRETRP